MGELDSWMDENYLRQLWWSFGDGGTYAFIDFNSHDAANKYLTSLNGSQIPNTNKFFKLNWSNRDGNGVPMNTKQV
jgi:hypothetical protein